MIFYIRQLYALPWIIVQQLRYQTLKILRDLFLRYFFPVLLSRVRITKFIIEIIVHCGILKRKAANDDDEEHDPYLKDVCGTAVVDFFVQDFGSHVDFGAVEGV